MEQWEDEVATANERELRRRLEDARVGARSHRGMEGRVWREALLLTEQEIARRADHPGPRPDP
jgi:hypothetical protein